MALGRRRHKEPEIKRLDWRDPDMPVLRYFEETNADCQVVRRGMQAVSPEDWQREAMFDMRDVSAPNWRNDPSYFWGERQSNADTADKDHD